MRLGIDRDFLGVFLQLYAPFITVKYFLKWASVCGHLCPHIWHILLLQNHQSIELAFHCYCPLSWSCSWAKRILPLLDQLYECKHISIPLENLIIPTQLILSPNCTCKRYKTYCFNECSKRILHNSYIGNYKNKPYPLLNLQITFVKQYAKTVGVIRCILIWSLIFRQRNKKKKKISIQKHVW